MLALWSNDETEALSLVVSDKLDEAVAACAEALRARADDAAALHAWGLVEFKRARYAEAAAYFERALSIDGGNPYLQNNCGEAHRLLGDLDRAFGCYPAALEIDNSSPAPHINLGTLMYARGKVAEAEHFFRNAAQLAPNEARPLIELAEFYREEGRTAEARRCYEEGISLDPEFVPWQARLATLLAEHGDTQEALVVLRRATDLPRADAEVWHERARLEFEMCEEEQAVAAYRRAARLRPDSSQHGAERLAVVRRVHPRAYCDRTASDCIDLARAQWMPLPPPPSLPPGIPSLRAPSDIIDPFSPEVLLLRLREVEIVPLDFSLLAEGRYVLVDGLVNRAQHYGQRGRHAVCESDDGRLLLDLPARIENEDRTCALLGGEGDLFAWMFEGLARLWGLEQRASAANVPLVVPEGLSESRLALLHGLGIGAERLLFLSRDRTLRCRDLWVPTLPIVADWPSPLAVHYLRRRLLASLGKGDARRRIYISRRGCDTHRLANEEELLPIIESNGFEVMNRERVDLIGLLTSLSQAEAILAIDDDDLACLVVAPQGTKVAAIASQGIYRPRAYCVSAQAGHAFTYLQAAPLFASHPVHAECDIHLPAELLREWLGSL